MKQTFYIEVDEAHPLLSGVFMLGMTNDGFSGLDAVDAYALSGPMTFEALAYDAGSEKNNELRGYLGALGEGNMRDPEMGVITRHTGIRGDADAPADWKFDPAAPWRASPSCRLTTPRCRGLLTVPDHDAPLSELRVLGPRKGLRTT